MISKEHITTAAKIYRMHETAKRFFGSEWPQKIADWKPVIERVMTKHNVSAIEAGIIMAKQMEELPEQTGFTVMMIFAVIKEMIEPETI